MKRHAILILFLATGWGCAARGNLNEESRSHLQQTIDAIDRNEWRRADALIEEILPPLPTAEEVSSDPS